MARATEQDTRNAVMALLTGTLGAAAYLVAMSLELDRLMLLLKPLPVLTLALWRGLAQRRFCGITAGLLCGALGDFLLAIPALFLPGMLAFALGHALYAAVFWRTGRNGGGWLLVPVALYLGFALSLMLPGAGAMALPMSAYMVVIGLMLWRAAVLAGDSTRPPLARWAPLCGALLFAFSDTLIGIDRFVVTLPGSAWPIMLTYWAAQVLIAVGTRHENVTPTAIGER